jgi:hypothetical protein
VHAERFVVGCAVRRIVSARGIRRKPRAFRARTGAWLAARTRHPRSGAVTVRPALRLVFLADPALVQSHVPRSISQSVSDVDQEVTWRSVREMKVRRKRSSGRRSRSCAGPKGASSCNPRQRPCCQQKELPTLASLAHRVPFLVVAAHCCRAGCGAAAGLGFGVDTIRGGAAAVPASAPVGVGGAGALLGCVGSTSGQGGGVFTPIVHSQCAWKYRALASFRLILVGQARAAQMQP